jgi:hypothetical protein
MDVCYVLLVKALTSIQESQNYGFSVTTYKSGKFLHVCFVGHGEEESFRVHKEVLSCRSDVFEAMMSHGMKEARCHIYD